ncbi:MAG: glycosyltransferase family 39 protein [Acidobacteria bacterium]|nr:glycosyltransferase family 39 protein [Acidobacteriota bacterium]
MRIPGKGSQLPQVINHHHLAFLILILASGAFLRFYRIGETQLWLDEIIQLARGSRPTLTEKLLSIQQDIAAAPLDYLVQNLFVSRWGNSPGVARLHAALFGTFSLPMIYLLARSFLGKNVALLSAALLAVYPLHVYYSQEGRNYSLFVFLSLCSSYLLVQAMVAPDPRRWLWFSLVTVLSLYTNYFAILLLVSQALFVLFCYGKRVGNSVETPAIKLRHTGLGFAASALLAFALFLPWMLSTYQNAQARENNVFSEPLLPFRILKELTGSHPLSLALLFFFIAGMVHLVRSGTRAKASLLLCGFLVPIPLALFLIWMRGYFFAVRHVLFAVPFLVIGAAAGICSLPALSKRTAAERVRAAAILLCLGLAGGTLYLHRSQQPADWQGLIHFLTREVGPKDVVVAPDIEAVLAYYSPHIRVEPLEVALKDTLPRPPGWRKFWVIRSIYNSPRNLELMNRLLASRTAHQRWKGFELFVYEKPAGSAE